MQAAILAVGSELLGSERVDTNSLRLAALLARFGVRVAEKSVVGDDRRVIARAVGRLVRDHELVLITGGLGPTQDDLTREAVAEASGRRLERSPEILEDLRRKFARFGIEMAPVNEKQADVLQGAEVLVNQRGTAPGQRLEVGPTTVFLFPGVPLELEGLVETGLEPWLAARSSGEGLESAVFKVACVPESTLEDRLRPFYEEWGEAGVALLPSAGQVTVRLDAQGLPDQRAAWLEPRQSALQELLGTTVFTRQQTGTLEEAAANALLASGMTLGTAESCTGGLIAKRLTDVAGSSRFFIGAVVSYADRVKSDLLGVRDVTLEQHGAVSREAAVAMARGLRRVLKVDLAVAVTGIAGPDGGSDEKPVGTVHVVLDGPGESEEHRLLNLPGNRERVRWVTSQWALDMIRRRLQAVRQAE